MAAPWAPWRDVATRPVNVPCSGPIRSTPPIHTRDAHTPPRSRLPGLNVVGRRQYRELRFLPGRVDAPDITEDEYNGILELIIYNNK